MFQRSYLHLNHARRFSTYTRITKPSAILYEWDGLLIRFRKKEFLFSLNETLKRFGANELHSLQESKSLRDTLARSCPNNQKEALIYFRESFSKCNYSQNDLQPSAIELLTKIMSYGLPQAVVSNLDKVILENEISKLRLNQYFHLIIGSHNDEHLKPKPDLIFNAIEKLELPLNKPNINTRYQCKLNRQIWYIGDSIGDVIASNRAGCTSILVNDTVSGACLEEEKADIVLNNLQEIIQLISHMMKVTGKTR
jgi:phosphoglycolate phosphatase